MNMILHSILWSGFSVSGLLQHRYFTNKSNNPFIAIPIHLLAVAERAGLCTSNAVSLIELIRYSHFHVFVNLSKHVATVHFYPILDALGLLLQQQLLKCCQLLRTYNFVYMILRWKFCWCPQVLLTSQILTFFTVCTSTLIPDRCLNWGP